MTKIELNGQIVTDNVGELYSWFGLTMAYPKAIKRALMNADGDDITLEINSQGGYVTAGYEIYNALKEYKGNITANVVFAASAATIVACAADKTYISEAGLFMIHNCSSSAEGDYREFENQADALKQFNEGILNVYESKTGKTRDELQKLMDDSTYMGPSRAIELGFVDGYIDRGNKEPDDSITDTQRMEQFVASVANTSNLVSDDDAIKVLSTLKMQQAIDNNKTKPTGTLPEDPKKMLDQADESLKSINNNDTEDKGGNSMTLEEVLNEHPEIQAEIDAQVEAARNEGRDSGVTAERERLHSLDEIKDAVPEEMLNDAKYGEKPMNGEQLAYQAMVQGKQTAQAYLKDAITDSRNSNVESVGAGNIETGTPNDTTEADADAMASYVNAKHGYSNKAKGETK